MTCRKCEGEVTERKITADAPFPYPLSGLSNLYLVGIVMRRCTSCEAENPVIPKLGELHKSIANTLLQKPVGLTGEELRFLRKHVGTKACDFAAQLAVEPETLSRFENGSQPLGESTEKLARVVVMAAMANETEEELSEFVRRKERLLERKNKAITERRFSYAANRWREVAA